MNSKKQRIAIMSLVLAVLYLLVLIDVGIASDTESNRASLKGIKGVRVSIERLEHEVKEVGLTEDMILTDVELRLRKAGIRVFTKEESDKIPGTPFLNVSINTMENKVLNAHLTCINVKLYQEVYLVRDVSIKTTARTWSAEACGIVPNIVNKKEVREKIADLVDIFINTYLAVNPR
jgi:hypothetical protein